jgi:hypothetical protein
MSAARPRPTVSRREVETALRMTDLLSMTIGVS